MARDPIIKKAISKALETAKGGLTFSELSKKVKEILGRAVYDSVLDSAIKSLVKDKSIEKKFIQDNITYSLSRQSHKQTVKDFLIDLTESFNLEELIANFALDKTSLPCVVSMSPLPMDEYEICEKSNYKFSVSVDWSNPSQAISSIISNDYLLLPKDIQEGIANLILWSYWVSLQEKMVSFTFKEITLPPHIKNLQRCKTYAKENLKSAKEEGDSQRVRTEKAIIDILSITLQLLKKQNLSEFLFYAHQKIDFVKKRENIILSTHGHFMASGERTFNNLIFEKSDSMFEGLQNIGDKVGVTQQIRSVFKENNLSLDTRVWNNFIDFLLELYPNDFVNNFNGSFDEAIEKGKRYAKYSNDLISLFEKRQMAAIYLWNIPVKMESEKYFKLPEFDEWYKALESGNLSHRIWLFEEGTIRDVESAYRCVRRNKAPKPWRIDKEPWTLKDIFDLHPKGKDQEFWHTFVVTLKTQQGKDPYRGGPVPKNVYYEMLKKEREAVKELINKDRN